MNIAVLNNHVPFVSGGAEYLADALVSRLTAQGHRVVLYRIPFRWAPPDKIIEAMLACRLIRLAGVDRVIALKFPVYYVPHPNKVLWLLHQFRQAYDLWGTPWQDLPDTPEGRQVRRTIIQADNALLPEARALYANSDVTAERLKRFNGLDSEVLYPPLFHPERFSCGEYGDYVFYPSRLTHGKRQHLVVEAMRHTRTPVRLVIAGGPDGAEALRQLEALVESGGLTGRVRIIPRFITEEEKVRLFEDALACAYTPIDEDSYGFVTLEAYASCKPVISCTDSGGVGLVVKNGDTGYLVNPRPEEIARAMDELFLNKARARELGQAGHRLIETMNITWDHVIERLTA
jgi:glycosyltransferase involved in cell wall biosynthesis